MALTAKKVYAILKRQISDMEAKLNSPVRYRGTVATADLLPLNPDIGDMYNIESKSVYGEAGMNVAWNGVVWDTMGAPIDMSLYIKSSELADWVKQQNKPTYTAEEVGALPADTKIPSKTSDLQNDSGFLTKIPDNYLSGTDKTLNVSGKAADAKATGDKITELSADISNKLNKNQGSENSGKIAGINESGDIVPIFPVGVDYNSETNCLEFGSDQKMELNQGIGLDSTLTKAGSAADAGAVGEITNLLKTDLNNMLSPNLFNPKDAKENTAINQDDGTEMSFDGWLATGYIPVSKNDVLYFSSNEEPIPYSTGAFYDKNKQRVDSFGNPNNNNNITVTSDGYARFSFGTAPMNLQIEKGSRTTYVPYGELKVKVEVDNVKEDLDNKITKFYASNQGETHITDSDNGKIQDMMLYGKSEQNQYKGINLLPTGISYREIIEVSIPKETRIFWATDGTPALGGNFRFYNEDKTQDSWFGIDTGKTAMTITINIDAKYMEFLVSKDQSVKMCLGIGDDPVYEPYTGGQPSPSPDYPQEIKSVVNPTVKVSSEDETESQTVTLPYTLNAIPVSSDGNVTINGQQYIADYADVKRGKLVKMVDSSKLDNTQSIMGKTEWLLVEPQEIDLTQEEMQTLKTLATYYPTTNIFINSEQLDGYTVFNYPISMANGWNYVKKQLNDNRDYIYDMDTRTQDTDLQAAEAYVNSEYAVALTELEV